MLKAWESLAGVARVMKAALIYVRVERVSMREGRWFNCFDIRLSAYSLAFQPSQQMELNGAERNGSHLRRGKHPAVFFPVGRLNFKQL